METPDAPRYRVPDDIAWIDGTEIGMGEELYLTRLPSGETVRLAGTARMVWHQAVNAPLLVDGVAELVGLSSHEIDDEVSGFVHRLVDSGFLMHRRASPR